MLPDSFWLRISDEALLAALPPYDADQYFTAIMPGRMPFACLRTCATPSKLHRPQKAGAVHG
tara:strand:+ start:188 stop:373 length:186 start_codon:yes stop_codon:yes gene_type:complete